jgi:hypothetical protein
MHTLHKERKKEIIWFGTVCIKFYIRVHTPAPERVHTPAPELDVNNIFKAC